MKQLIIGLDVGHQVSITACFLLEKPKEPREEFYDADIEAYNANLENLNKLKAKIESKVSQLKLSERRFMRAVGMGVVREDSGQKKKGKQSGSALCRKALWQWCFTRLEVSKNNPPLLFNYGQGDEQELRSPAADLKIRKKGGTRVKLARQRVVARCIRELFNVSSTNEKSRKPYRDRKNENGMGWTNPSS